jgi:hypothetical protein
VSPAPEPPLLPLPLLLLASGLEAFELSELQAAAHPRAADALRRQAARGSLWMRKGCTYRL